MIESIKIFMFIWFLVFFDCFYLRIQKHIKISPHNSCAIILHCAWIWVNKNLDYRNERDIWFIQSNDDSIVRLLLYSFDTYTTMRANISFFPQKTSKHESNKKKSFLEHFMCKLQAIINFIATSALQIGT